MALNTLPKILVGLMALLMGAPFCIAQETLDYLGAPMIGTLSFYGGIGTGFVGTPPPEFDFQPPDPLALQNYGTIVLSSPLNPNEADQVVKPLTWAFDNAPILTYLGPDVSFPLSEDAQFHDSWMFSTLNGNIVGWNITVTNDTGNYAQSLTLSSVSGDTYGSSVGSGTCYYFGTCEQFGASNLVAGTWTVVSESSGGSVPAVPEFGNDGAQMIAFFIGAALVLRINRNRRKALLLVAD